jgi:glycosyltransferase involved in cell wall biosynthesis
MKLSVIIPVYNERATIEEILKRVLAVEMDLEVVVVDDASTDGTREYLQSLSPLQIKILLHPQNRGKGAAIRTGLSQAGGEAVIIQDADLEYDPQDYHKLLAPIIQGKAEVVYGSRFLDAGNPRRGRFHYWGNRTLTWFTNLLYGGKLTDEATCYKVVKMELLRSLDLRCERFEFCPEVTAKILRKKIPITEVPITYFPRSFAEGKKIRLQDGFEALFTLLRYRFWS